MNIGVISDTHGLLRPEVLSALATCHAILLAGDIKTAEVLDALRAIAPLYAVRGNNDKDWADPLPELLTFELGGRDFIMVHDRKSLPKELGDTNVVIFGHSHNYIEQWIDGRLWLNPGSCGRRRFRLEATMAILKIDNGIVKVKRIALS